MTYENRSIGGLFLNIGRSPAGSCLLDEHLDADVLSHNESGAVQEEKRQKAAHAAVSVIERVDAKEVQDEYRHQDQRIIGRGLDGIIVSGAEVPYGIGRLEGRDREEADCFRAVGVLLCNDVVRVFIYTTYGAAAEGIEVPVQLEDAVGARGDVFVGFVDGGQHVAVAGDAVHRSDGQHRQ